MDYQLELIDVAKQYKEFLAVDSVNLQIEKEKSSLFSVPAAAVKQRHCG